MRFGTVYVASFSFYTFTPNANCWSRGQAINALERKLWEDYHIPLVGFTHANQYRLPVYPLAAHSQPQIRTSTNIHPRAAAFSSLLRGVSAASKFRGAKEERFDDQMEVQGKEDEEGLEVMDHANSNANASANGLLSREVFAIITDDWNNPYCQYITQYFTQQQPSSSASLCAVSPDLYQQEISAMKQIPILAFDSHRLVESSVVDQWLQSALEGSLSTAITSPTADAPRISFFPLQLPPPPADGALEMIPLETFHQWTLDHLQKTVEKRREEMEQLELIPSEKIRDIQVSPLYMSSFYGILLLFMYKFFC